MQDAIKGDLGVMPFEQARETAYAQDVSDRLCLGPFEPLTAASFEGPLR